MVQKYKHGDRFDIRGNEDIILNILSVVMNQNAALNSNTQHCFLDAFETSKVLTLGSPCLRCYILLKYSINEYKKK